jgi:2-keto-4-pentenoate hydratase
VEDGERAQLAVLSRWVQQGGSRAGWKVGLTSGAVRDSFGAGVRPFGFILSDRVFSSGATIDLGRMSRPGLETELCFRVGRRLSGPGVDAAEVEESIDWVAPAFELNETRIDGPQDPGVRVADNLTQWGIVVGPAVSPLPDRSAFERVVVTLTRDGQVLETVAAAGYIDDHYLSIARLAKELSKFDLAVEEGDLVITGSMARQKDGIPPGEYVGSFAGIGEVRANFAGPR